ncbi:MAG TPA: hypothetical protein VFI08_12670, partial [Spirochaetia bacterium]|nr:hypothetical protein [Spirochaetia bacterium]
MSKKVRSVLMLVAAPALAVLLAGCHANSLLEDVKQSVEAAKAPKDTAPTVDSFVVTSGPLTYTGSVTFTLASTKPGTGASAITSWQVNESASPPAANDPRWGAFTSPQNGTCTLANPGTYGTRTLYAWLLNDKGFVSAPATQSVQYAQLGGPSIDTFQATPATSYDGNISVSITSTHPGSGATAVTAWLVNESSTSPLPTDPNWKTGFTSPQSGSYTLANLGAFGARPLYAWIKNDKNVVSASATQTVTYSA